MVFNYKELNKIVDAETVVSLRRRQMKYRYTYKLFGLNHKEYEYLNQMFAQKPNFDCHFGVFTDDICVVSKSYFLFNYKEPPHFLVKYVEGKQDL